MAILGLKDDSRETDGAGVVGGDMFFGGASIVEVPGLEDTETVETVPGRVLYRGDERRRRLSALFTVGADLTTLDVTTFVSVRSVGQLCWVAVEGGGAGARVVMSKVLEKDKRVREPSSNDCGESGRRHYVKETKRLAVIWKLKTVFGQLCLALFEHLNQTQ